jgi:ABC-type lipoprotein export system ATPase subunit/multidrug efflux pump subunit AcrA (membrane-fusion protein)
MAIPGMSFIGNFYRNHRRLSLLAVAAAIVALAVGTFGFTRRENVQYFPATVEQGDIQAVVNATGTINAVTTVQVGSQVSGNIAELNADFNSHVTKGQVVARIDPAIFQTRVLQVEADLANAQAGVTTAHANLSRAEANLRPAELNLKRTMELFERGIASAQERDTVQSAYDAALADKQSAEAQISQARAQVKQRQAAVEQARLDLQHTVIRTPIDGTVIARNVDIGQTVAASLQAPTLFTIAQDLTKMLVYAKTDESDVGKIRVGAQANFKVDSFPNDTFYGRVTQVRMNATTIQNVVTYDTIIEFENRDQKLLPGMTAYVTIPVGSANNVVKIPNGALRYTPDMPEEQRRALLKQYNLLGPPPEEAKKESGEGTAQAKEKPAEAARAGRSPRRLGQHERGRPCQDARALPQHEPRGASADASGVHGAAPGAGAAGRLPGPAAHRPGRGRRLADCLEAEPGPFAATGACQDRADGLQLHHHAGRRPESGRPARHCADRQQEPANQPTPRPLGPDAVLRFAPVENHRVLQLEDLHKIYDLGEVKVPALRGVSLGVEQGEFVAIMGASGSGKSTMMNIIAADRPTRGHYYLDGRRPQLTSEERAHIRNRKSGSCSSINLLSRTSALENVELPMLYSGVASEKRRDLAQAALHLVGLTGREDHHPSQLSGGQQQRVAIARALVNQPSILLADEPTGNLDSRTSNEIMGLLELLNREQGLLVVLVTHEADIAAHARRVVFMRDGLILRDLPVSGDRHQKLEAVHHMMAAAEEMAPAGE